MAVLLLLASVAFAQDAAPPPSTDPGIVQLVEGTVVTPPAASKLKPFTVTTHSYLLPEPMYDRALTKAMQLDICQPAFEKSAAQTLAWIEVSQKALDACQGQFDADAATVEALRGKVVDLEARANAAETRLKDVRTQRNTAWAITGGLVLGAIAVTAVAVGG